MANKWKRFRADPVRLGIERVDREDHIIYGVSAAQAVEALGHGVMLDRKSLDQIVELGNGRMQGVKSRYTHPGMCSDGMGKLLGRTRNFRVVGDKALCDLHLSESAFKSPDGDLGSYILDLAEHDADLFGMSIVFEGKPVWTLDDGTEADAWDEERWGMTPRPDNALTEKPVMRIEQLFAVDAVDEPAANRDGLFSANLWGSNQTAEAVFGELDGYLARYGVPLERAQEFARRYFVARGIEQLESEEDEFEGEREMEFEGATPAPVTAVAEDTTQAQIDSLRRELFMAQAEARVEASGLQPVSKQVVRKGLASTKSLAEVDELIEAQRGVEAELTRASVVQGMRPLPGQVTGMLTSMDQLTLAVEALFDGRRPAYGIKPLQGIRELYLMTSGDYEMTGVFQPGNVAFANVNTGTMPLIIANAMNKKVVSMFQSYDNWWSDITVEEDAPNLHDIRWHKLGGIGEMPLVPEGQAYTEAEWAEDYESAGWTKKGHYIGLTLEVIDRDDTRRIVQAPRALAMSAWLTLGKDVSRLFTQNAGVGPTMRDGKAWFHNDHNNLGSTAFSKASVMATIIAMQKQTEIGTGERLGGITRPTKFLIPLDLEFTAIEVLASALDPNDGATTGQQKENPLAEGDSRSARIQKAKSMIKTMQFWTDTNDWAAMADPNLMPSVGVSYRFGRAPEIFSVQDERSGLMFSNDVMPIKTRWFYSLGIIDHRGVYKHNVAGG